MNILLYILYIILLVNIMCYNFVKFVKIFVVVDTSKIDRFIKVCLFFLCNIWKKYKKSIDMVYDIRYNAYDIR